MNLTKAGQIIVAGIFYARTWRQKAQGLLGKDQAEPMYLRTRWGIHTFGMKFPIDVVVCDRDLVVQKIFADVGPGRIIIWNPKWNHIFELPPGTAQNFQLGDKLHLE